MGLSRSTVFLALTTLVVLSMVAGIRAAPLANLTTTWTPDNVLYTPDGRGCEISMKSNNTPYGELEFKQSYQYGGFGAWIKLPGGNSAGTVTTFYLSSSGPNHCEFDFEFLGNLSGQPFILHTNIFVNGVGGREIQYELWFDPTLDYHYYSVQWNKDLVLFFVDNTPIRVFLNLEGNVTSFEYPKSCPMNLFISIWDGDSWATEGGRIKLDWNAAPFVASFRSFKLDGCPATPGVNATINACQNSKFAAPGPALQTLSTTRKRKLRNVKANYVHYNYCTDSPRYPVPPPECKYNIL